MSTGSAQWGRWRTDPLGVAAARGSGPEVPWRLSCVARVIYVCYQGDQQWSAVIGTDGFARYWWDLPNGGSGDARIRQGIPWRRSCVTWVIHVVGFARE